MTNKFDNVSMIGRLAYINMCVEKYLVAKYPDRDWCLISEPLWKATSMNWAEWPELYCCYIPDVLFQYSHYDTKDFGGYMSSDIFDQVKSLYSGITTGNEDDPSDIVNALLNKPYEMAMVYEGTEIGNGQESLTIIQETEDILLNQGIELPDYRKVLFSTVSERNGWGEYFNGEYLSILL